MAREKLKKLFIDFDGVIHRYDSGWLSPSEIPDDPVKDPDTGRDAIQWITSLIQSGHFEIHIYSRRGSQPEKGGIGAMKMWFQKHGLAERYLKKIKFETGKPDAYLIIDDRCVQFDGTFADPLELKNFKTWWQKEP